MREAAAAEAQGTLQQGQIRGQMIGTLGQLAGGAFEQHRQDQLDAPRRELLGLQVESARGSLGDAQRERAEDQALRELFSRTDPNSGQPVMPQADEIYSVVGPKRGTEIVKAIEALQTQRLKSDTEARQWIGSMVSGILALPEAMREEAYGLGRQKGISLGIPAQYIPEQYSPEVLQQAQMAALSPDKAYEAQQPKPMVVGGNIVDARAPGAPPIYEAPPTPVLSLSPDKGTLTNVGTVPANAKVVAEPQPPRVTVNAAAQRYMPRQMTTADGQTVMANYDAKTGKYFEVDTGQELRGLKPPPTADMRNKQEGRRLVERSIAAIEDLSKKVITKRGVAQRATAAGRSVEATLGRDPEYRTYQDARMALAGNLAVAQQGSRPSDADIKAIWLPLVPDVFRDTDESALMKWNLIKTMSNVEAGGGQGGADPLGIR
jgi:hypothetical protein